MDVVQAPAGYGADHRAGQHGPVVAADETANKIGSEAAFSLVFVMSHAARVRTVHSKDADTLRDTRG